MTIGPYPEFSWSVSRAGTFSYCPRRYYYRYHGGWGGWDQAAPERSRQIWLIAKRTALPAWVGQHVHRGISLFLTGHEEMAAIAAGVGDRMRREFALSRSREFMTPGRAKLFGLVEHYYGEDIGEAALGTAERQVRVALEAFGRTDFREAVRAARRAGTRLYVEPAGDPDFEGMRVHGHGLGTFPLYVAPDLVLERESGHVEILDWKSGKPPADEPPERMPPQLALHTLWVSEKFGGLDAIAAGGEAYEHYLPSGRLVGGRLRADDLDAALDYARRSVAEIRARLRDPGLNDACEEDFPARATPARCAACEFRGACDAAQGGGRCR